MTTSLLDRERESEIYKEKYSEFVIDKDLSSGNPGSPLTHPLPRSTSSNNNLADIKRPLCSRLFERKSVNERFDELGNDEVLRFLFKFIYSQV